MRLSGWQGYDKPGAFAGGADDIDTTLMSENDLTGDGQSQSGAAVQVCTLLETLEYKRYLLLWDTGACIGNGNFHCFMRAAA